MMTFTTTRSLLCRFRLRRRHKPSNKPQRSGRLHPNGLVALCLLTINLSRMMWRHRESRGASRFCRLWIPSPSCISRHRCPKIRGGRSQILASTLHHTNGQSKKMNITDARERSKLTPFCLDRCGLDDFYSSADTGEPVARSSDRCRSSVNIFQLSDLENTHTQLACEPSTSEWLVSLILNVPCPSRTF